MQRLKNFSEWLSESKKSIMVRGDNREALTAFLAEVDEKPEELPLYSQEDELYTVEFMEVDKKGEEALEELLKTHKQVKKV